MTSPQTDAPDAIARLTRKERECLSRWLGHATAKEIALDLGISHHAVEKRLKAARQKLGVATSLEAARLLEAAEGYGGTASQPAEVAAPLGMAHIQTVGGTANSQSPPSRRRHWITGATIMSLALLAALTLAAIQPADTREPEVMVIDKRKGVPGQVEAAADKAFARLDKNGSGVLEATEIPNVKVRAIRVGGDDQPSPGVDADPAAADADGDKSITRAEFRTWMGGLTTGLRSIADRTSQ